MAEWVSRQDRAKVHLLLEACLPEHTQGPGQFTSSWHHLQTLEGPLSRSPHIFRSLQDIFTVTCSLPSQNVHTELAVIPKASPSFLTTSSSSRNSIIL